MNDYFLLAKLRLFFFCLDGVKLIKSVLRQLLEIYNLPKLMPKLQQKTAHMLAMTINATAQKPSTSAG